jgi:hypothetical protein
VKKYSDLGQHRRESKIIKQHNKFLTHWFKRQHQADPPPMNIAEEKLIFFLSQGLACNLVTYRAYDINGYTFYMEKKDKNSDYQNSGVTMKFFNGDIKERYYGRIEEIWELDYYGEKVPMFCIR